MPERQWPSREEWQARAEYAVRTWCPAADRLPEDAVFSTPAEDAEALALIGVAAAGARSVATAAIGVLRERLPGRPSVGRARIAWFLDLDAETEVLASELAQLESARTRLARAVRTGHQGMALEELRHITDSPTVEVPAEVAAAVARLGELGAVAAARRARAADEAQQKAIAAEIDRRRTDEAWALELERRRRAEAGPVIVRYGV
ncbi:hypothetical protein [Streptomyces yangpuensis]|uniref:hypothetical protein n=1 Tax=Streptomyces yangpuensis TaxID=1648182 RepID=UPI003656D0C6